jgi:hypothetical protein
LELSTSADGPTNWHSARPRSARVGGSGAGIEHSPRSPSKSSVRASMGEAPATASLASPIISVARPGHCPATHP